MNDAQTQCCPSSNYSVVSPILTSILYGIALTLYCFCVRSVRLGLRTPDQRRRAIFTLIYLSLLMVLITCFLVMSIAIVRLFSIKAVGFAQGLSDHDCQLRITPPVILVFGGIWTTVQVLNLGIQIWRCWIIWSSTRYVFVCTILPVVLVTAYVVLFIVVAAWSSHHPVIPQEMAKIISITIFGLGPAITTIVTVLITGRLLLVRRQHMKILGLSKSANPYLSIVTMLVESYALETAWSLAALILSAAKSPSCVFLTQNDPIVKCIAHFLIVYRVRTGRGWTKQTEDRLTSLQWHRNAETETAPIGSQSV